MICLWLGFVVGCGSSNSSTTNPDSVTLIAVNPSDFPPSASATPAGAGGTAGSSALATANAAGSAGELPTSAGRAQVEPSTADAPGSARPIADGNCGIAQGSAYVAELYDVSEWLAKEAGPPENPFGDFLVQSSPATSCDRTVVFGRVISNRKYVAKVNVYADTDGDPNTIDVCTIHGTSLTFIRNPNTDCATTLAQGTRTPAQPIRTLTCYGWQVATAPGVGGAAALPNVNAAVAIQYRTVPLHYCAE